MNILIGAILGLFLAPLIVVFPIKGALEMRSGFKQGMKSLLVDAVLSVFVLGFCLQFRSVQFWSAFLVAGAIAVVFTVRLIVNSHASKILFHGYLAQGKSIVESQVLAKSDLELYGAWIALGGLRNQGNPR